MANTALARPALAAAAAVVVVAAAAAAVVVVVVVAVVLSRFGKGNRAACQVTLSVGPSLI